ncbi:aldolase/citrate lyase family protein [Magnetofaba australis]|uniref:HpcH/HpaI aldolase/citrate lyase domain-containing protein n=1 Tax=Magnetofaba australis IT-1 TaxID=1434232 RepID=A0A1Y2K551_9PROT|nr:aldolase/citrate lyase family protein [Magnetofaba australis]OSM04801.1 hypothetical protein MAIT1_02894 [Magnetofaba australis IT-1]
MFGAEGRLYEQLCLLRDEFGLEGVKAEYEAEGSSFADLVRLRRVTLKAGVPMFLKIGGPEAVSDIRSALEVGVDGLIAPMVESRFGLKKFVAAYHKIYGDYRIHLSFNLETRNAVEELDDLLEFAPGRVDNVTVGRSDLAASFEREEVTPDSAFILDLVESVSERILPTGLTMTMGGSLSQMSMDLLKQRPKLCAAVSRLETRKVILPTENFVHNPNAIQQALKFEELYILAKRDVHNTYIDAEINRLTQLQRRK